jgi:cytochrome d ubiquinol oxidase subunit I
MDVNQLAVVDWSRAQFALTALYHWLFVPLTLGLSFLVAIMESIYVKTGNEAWKKLTKFWMTLFGINFAIGVATGIILEFEFGTNWSNYSWLVGDIFGAPLAIEGIMAFFMESTFIAIMFFGWNKVSKRVHLASSWLTAIGSNLSALWILVANGWMQYPVGMHFNIDTARNEMTDFWTLLFSPVAINKFLHTVLNGYVLASLFVIAVSAWYLLKNREIVFAKRSIGVASSFGLLAIIYLIFTGDGSAYEIAHKQPMKMAAMENLYNGKTNAGISLFGIVNNDKKYNDNQDAFHFNIEIPSLLSILGYHSSGAFVPGVKDIIEGYETTGENGITVKEPSAQEKIEMGKKAREAMAQYQLAKKSGDTESMETAKVEFENNVKYFGYGFLNDVDSLIPNVPITFYSFRIMVGLGFWFLIFLGVMFFKSVKNTLTSSKLWLQLGILTSVLGWVATEMGWIVAEVGRQPWTIQDMLPVSASASMIDASSVQITFFMFLAVFTLLLIAEIRIMKKQIGAGPNNNQN